MLIFRLREFESRVGKMVQLINALAAKPVDSGSVLRSHMAEGDKCLLQGVLGLSVAVLRTACPHIHTHNKSNKTFC